MMTQLSLKNLQQQMMNYLLDDDMTIAGEITQQGNISNQVRLHIYQNAYNQRLKEVIDNDHQLLGLYLGDNLFDQMVTGYIKAFPSGCRSLRHYADQLPEFLKVHTPFNDYPIISELAQFERLLLTAFDAADTTRLTINDLQQMPELDWPELVLHFHPSVQIAYFSWNCVESWQALKAEKSPDEAINNENVWLVWRNRQRLTEFRSLDTEELSLINMILKGENFSSLCDFLLSRASDNDVSHLALSYLSTWIEQGIIKA